MKKLIIAAASVCLAALVQAGTVTWSTGTMYVAADTTGGWATGTANTIKAQEVNVYWALFLTDADTYASLATKSQAELWETYGNSDLTKISTGADASGQTFDGSTYAAAASWKDSAATGVEQGVMVAAYEANGQIYYIAKAAQSTWASATSKGTAGNIISGVADWQTVPEPTSGLLLLIGMAGLALRRRRA